MEIEIGREFKFVATVHCCRWKLKGYLKFEAAAQKQSSLRRLRDRRRQLRLHRVERIDRSLIEPDMHTQTPKNSHWRARSDQVSAPDQRICPSSSSPTSQRRTVARRCSSVARALRRSQWQPCLPPAVLLTRSLRSYQWSESLAWDLTKAVVIAYSSHNGWVNRHVAGTCLQIPFPFVYLIVFHSVIQRGLDLTTVIYKRRHAEGYIRVH